MKDMNKAKYFVGDFFFFRVRQEIWVLWRRGRLRMVQVNQDWLFKKSAFYCWRAFLAEGMLLRRLEMACSRPLGIVGI